MTDLPRAATGGEAAPVPSPCTNVCRIDSGSGWCEGCLRTIDEIAAWGSLDDAARRAVWKQLSLRRQALAGARPHPEETPR